MTVFRYQVYQARLRERLLTSGDLPGDSTCILEAEPGKFDNKRRELVFFLSAYQVDSLFEYDVIIDFLCRFSVIGDVILKMKRHHDLIKAQVKR